MTTSREDPSAEFGDDNNIDIKLDHRSDTSAPAPAEDDAALSAPAEGPGTPDENLETEEPPVLPRSARRAAREREFHARRTRHRIFIAVIIVLATAAFLYWTLRIRETKSTPLDPRWSPPVTTDNR